MVHLFRLGTYLPQPLRRLYDGYASDILVRLGAYFLRYLVVANLTFARDWRARAAVVSGAASIAQIGQGSGLTVLGNTFDPRDFAIFAVQ